MTQPPPKKKSLDELLNEEFSSAPQGASSLDSLIAEEFAGIPQGITEDPPRPAVAAALEEQNKIENANKLREMAKTASPERAARMLKLADQYAPEGTIRQTLTNAVTDDRLPGSNIVRGAALGAFRGVQGMGDLALGVTQALNPFDVVDEKIQGVRNNMQDLDALVKEQLDPQGVGGFAGQVAGVLASGPAWMKANVGALKGLQALGARSKALKPVVEGIERVIATGTAANAPLKSRLAAQALISGAADVAQVADILINDENYPDDGAKVRALAITLGGSAAGALVGSTKFGGYNKNPLTGKTAVAAPEPSPTMAALAAEQEAAAAANIARAEAAAARKKDWIKSVASSWKEANPGKSWSKDATDVEKTRWMVEVLKTERSEDPVVQEVSKRLAKVDAFLAGGTETDKKLARKEMSTIREMVREAAMGEPQEAAPSAPLGPTGAEPPPTAGATPPAEGTPLVAPSVGTPSATQPLTTDQLIEQKLAGLKAVGDAGEPTAPTPLFTPAQEQQLAGDLAKASAEVAALKPQVEAKLRQQELRKIADIVEWWDELSPKKRDASLAAAGFTPLPAEFRSALTKDIPPEFQQIVRAAMEHEQKSSAEAAAKTAAALGRGAGKGKAAEAAMEAEAKLAEENPLLHKIRATWSRAEAKKYPQMDDVTLAAWLKATEWKAENTKEPALQEIYGNLASKMQEEFETRALRAAQERGDQPTVDAILARRTNRAGYVNAALVTALRGPALRFMGGYLGGALYNTLENDKDKTPQERFATNVLAGAAAVGGPAALRALRAGVSQPGLSTKDVSTDWWKGPRWYSKLQRAIEASSSKVAPANDWLAYLSNPERGAARESAFTGLHTWLLDQGTAKVTREQVLAKLAENPLRVRVLWGGVDSGSALKEKQLYAKYNLAAGENLDDLPPAVQAEFRADLEELKRFSPETRWAPGGVNEGRFDESVIASLNLPGGQKHFELVVEMDPANSWKFKDDPHWPSDRVMAHLRGHFRDVEMPDGTRKQVLYIDELQSDVAQKSQDIEDEYLDDYGIAQRPYHDTSERWLHLLYASFMEQVKRTGVTDVVFSPWEVQSVRNRHFDSFDWDLQEAANAGSVLMDRINNAANAFGLEAPRGFTDKATVYFKDGQDIYRATLQPMHVRNKLYEWGPSGDVRRLDMNNASDRKLFAQTLKLLVTDTQSIPQDWKSFIFRELDFIRPASDPQRRPVPYNFDPAEFGLRKVPSEKQAGDRKFYGEIVPREFRKFIKKQLKVDLTPQEVTLADTPNPLTDGPLNATMFRITPEVLRNYDEFGVTASLNPVAAGAAVGMTYGMLSPAEDDTERARNTLYYAMLGMGVGAGGMAAAKRLGNAKTAIAKAQPQHIQDLRKIVKSAEDYEGGALSGDGLLTRIQKEWRSLYTGTVDPTKLWKEIGEVLGQQNQGWFTEGGKVAQVSSKMAEMYGLFRARAENALFGTGVVDWDAAGNKTVLYDKSLRDIVQMSGTGARELGELMFALRTLELAQQASPKGTGVAVPVAAKVVADATPEMYAAAQEARKYSLALAQMLENAGVLEGGTAAKFAQEDFYTPLRRLLGIDPNQRTGAATGPAVTGGAGSASVPNPVKPLKGSTLPVQNPVEALLDLTQRYMRAAELNRNVASFFSMLENADPTIRDEFLGQGKLAQRVLGGQSKNAAQTNANAKQLSAQAGVSVEQAQALLDMLDSKTLTMADGTVRYYQNGKVVSYRVREDVLKMFKYLSGDELKDFLDNTFGRLAEGVAGSAKVGITGSPLFILRQAIRDIHQYTLNGTYGIVPGWAHLKALGYQSAGWWAQVANTKEFQLYKEFGGGGDSIADNALKIVQGKVELVSKLETKGDTYANQLVQKLKVKNLRDIRQAYAMVMAPIADAGRIGAYLHERGRGASVADAVWRSKAKGANYSQRGQWAIMHALNRTTLFLNPSLQSMEATKNAIKTNPLAYALHATFGISVPSMLFWLAAEGDDDVREVQTSSAGARNWVFRWNDQIYMLPKPILDGQLWGTSVERALAQYFEGAPDQAAQWAENVGNDLAVGLIPVIGVVPLSMTTNTRVGLGGQLAPEYEVPSQAMGGASEMSKMLSNYLIGGRVTTGAEWLDRLLSPAGIQWTIKTFSGTAGEDVTKVLDAMWKIENRVPQDANEYPFIASAFGNPNTMGAGSLRELYEQGAQATKAVQRYEELLISDPEAAAAWWERYAPLIATAPAYSAARNTVRDFRKAIADLEMLPDGAMSAAEKRELKKQFLEMMVLSARQGVQAARAVREGITAPQ